MADLKSITSMDSIVDNMRRARGCSAALKLRFLSVRQTFPRAWIFAFEGATDVSVYRSWICRIDDSFKYEPFPCEGKSQVLGLLDVLDRDAGGLSERVAYFIDRDFDDLRGRTSHARLFMTDTYSVENYLVNEDVLDEVLKDELRCSSSSACRQNVIGLFNSCYGQFLELTRELNFRIFVARRRSIDTDASLPKSLGKIVRIEEVDVCTRADTFEEDAILSLTTIEDCAALRLEFDCLEREQRYRGKFAMMFFTRWLEVLAVARKDPKDQLFAGLSREVRVNTQAISLGSLATRSAMPAQLSDFLSNARALDSAPR